MNDATTAPVSGVAAPEEADAPEPNGKTALADAFRTHFAGDAPLTEKAKSFAKARPWTSSGEPPSSQIFS